MQTRNRVVSCVCVATVVFTTGLAQAQQGFFGGGPTTVRIAAVPAVAEKFEFTDIQKELANKLGAADEKQRQELFSGDFRNFSREERQERMQKLRAQQAIMEEQLAKSLGKEKFQRMQQLSRQVGGIFAVILDRQNAKNFEITDEQRSSAFESLRGMRDEFRAAAEDAHARAKLTEKINEKLAAVLTPVQKEKWKEMQGVSFAEEFLGKIRTATTRRRVSE